MVRFRTSRNTVELAYRELNAQPDFEEIAQRLLDAWNATEAGEDVQISLTVEEADKLHWWAYRKGLAGLASSIRRGDWPTLEISEQNLDSCNLSERNFMDSEELGASKREALEPLIGLSELASCPRIFVVREANRHGITLRGAPRIE